MSLVLDAIRSCIVFVRYLIYLIRRPSMSRQDLLVAASLFVIYPGLLWLFLNVFHGICGIETYNQKIEAIAACKGVYFWFCFLMRSYKISIIHIYGVEKQKSERNLRVEEETASGGLKCQTWFHLSQEMALVGWVAFLLLICLPVLAFYSMFITMVVTFVNILILGKRLWKTAQAREESNNNNNSEEGDMEFQEFLTNFGDADPADP